MFRITKTAAGLAATLALTAVAYGGGVDQAPERAPVPGVDNENRGGVIEVEPRGPFADDLVKTAPMPGFDNEKRGGEVIIAPRGPFGHDLVKTAPLPGFEDDKRGGEVIIVIDGPFGDVLVKPTGAPGLDDQDRGTRGDGTSSGASVGDEPPPASRPDQGLGNEGEGVVNYDITGDGRVNFMDLIALLSEWGAHRGAADLTGDHMVDIRDLVLFLANVPPEITPTERTGPTGVGVPTKRDFIRPDGRRVIDFGTVKDVS